MDSDRDLLLISVFTFLTVSLWIFFELVKTYKTSTVNSTTEQVIIPLSPKLDTETLDVLNEKLQL